MLLYFFEAMLSLKIAARPAAEPAWMRLRVLALQKALQKAAGTWSLDLYKAYMDTASYVSYIFIHSQDIHIRHIIQKTY